MHLTDQEWARVQVALRERAKQLRREASSRSLAGGVYQAARKYKRTEANELEELAERES